MLDKTMNRCKAYDSPFCKCPRGVVGIERIIYVFNERPTKR
ncbi:MAG: hypothetical protein ACTSUT_00830 [Promethearchaeota archaeon]